MIPNFTKSIQSVIIAAILLCGTSLKAQDFGQIIAAGGADANTYLESYLKPAMNSLGNGLANGWYNTGKAHKTLGVDITASFNMAQVPEAERLFQFLGSPTYNNMILEPGNTTNLPTLVGGEAPNEEIVVPVGDVDFYGQSVPVNEEMRFDVPGGIDMEEVPVITGLPVPTAQLGIGIYKNTDLKIRLIPEINLDDFRLKMFGIGVLHDVKQWIPGIKNLPFDLSGFFGTTKFTAERDITVSTQSNSGSTSFDGEGTASFTSSATTIQAIISKKLLVFTPYAAIGVNIVNSKLAITGDYEYQVSGQPYTISDPVNLEFTGSGGPRFTIGGRLKLAVFTFHFDYTAQKYSTITGGVGISIR